MSIENESEIEIEKTERHHAELLTVLPKAVGSFTKDMYLYQDSWLYPDALLSVMLMQNHFNHRSTDIFLTSFMKSGTTWLKSLMFTTLNRSHFDFSNHPLLRKGPHECFRALSLYHPKDNAVTDLDVRPCPSGPRLFGAHFMHKLFPSSVTDPSSGCKFVYVCRDPKDVLVSMWHFVVKLRSKEQPSLTLDEMFRMFCEDVVEYGPYWEHVLGFWNASVESPDKILFLKYEEIKRDPELHVKKLAEFMGVPISVQEEENGMVTKIAEFCSFENLKSLEINKSGVFRAKNELVVPNHTFFRRGDVGDWKRHLTVEMGDEIDRITDHKLKGSGLTLG